MRRVELCISPEKSDRLFILLTSNGVSPQFEQRGAAGDVVWVPASKSKLAQQLIDEDES